MPADLQVTGSISPDLTGTYEYYGPYAGRPSYKHMTQNWWIWWNGDADWFLSDGPPPYDYYAIWNNGDYQVAATYYPFQNAAGNATVAESAIEFGWLPDVLEGWPIAGDDGLALESYTDLGSLYESALWAPWGGLDWLGQDEPDPWHDPVTDFRLTEYVDLPCLFLQRYYLDARGLYRIFDDAEYRFYRSNSSPPAETDTPFATSSSLPHTPADTYAEGTWYLSVSYYNGLYDSGFLPVGPRGEHYLRLDISSGQEIEEPPQAPLDMRLEERSGGVVRIHAIYSDDATLRADEWAIAYTTDGSTPPESTPGITVAIPAAGLAVLQYDLPAQADGTTVKVRVQVRRDDSGTYRYSEGSTVLTVTIDTTGPAAAEEIEIWSGA